MVRQYTSGERTQGLIAFGVVGVLGEGEAGLGDRLDLPRPDQPNGFAGGFGRQAQFADSGTSVGCGTPAPDSDARSASVSIRQEPPASTSAGRKRALYAIFRLSGTQ
jgi:hypothetical protein